MRHRCNAAPACIAGLLLLVGGATRANEADDAIQRLATQAQEQAKAGNLEGVAETLGEIITVLPNASPDGVSAVSELNRNLAQPDGTGRSQSTFPAVVPAPGDLPLPQRRDSPVVQPASPPGPLFPSPSEHPSIPTPAVISPPPAEITQTSNIRLMDLLRRRGDTALGTGDISGARRFYERGAEVGCGACAEALARTYDAEQLRRMNAMGIKPDPAQAMAWRTRAKQLGWTDAP